MRQFKPSALTPIASLILAIFVSWNYNICSAQLVGDDLELPYQALVLHDGATIHSGPGQVHYPTQRLKQGAAVEVYRHDPGGWCAIRPVSESFSLVPESTLELVDEGVGKITEDGTQAWVGTELGAVEKPLWQVKLRKDELVEVLGQVSWPSAEGHSTIWYQIASPAGEFRWIRMSDIQLPVSTALADLNQTPVPTAANPTQTVRSLSEIITRSPALDVTDPSASTYAIAPNHEGMQTSYQYQSASALERPGSKTDSINRGWRQATRPINKNGTSSTSDSGFSSSSSFSDHPSGLSFNSQAHQHSGFASQSPGRKDLAYENGTMRVANADVAALNLAGELNSARSILNAPRGATTVKISDLELRLTNEILKNDPSQWRLDELESAANSILRNSIDVGERALAEKFVNKISNCRTIQTGYKSNLGAMTTGSVAGQTRPVGTSVDGAIELNTTYDAHGWLNKMVRDGGSRESTFVLQDASGKITHHVSPIPGLNLHRYLKSRVGIVGQRGYHSQLKLDHVTAHRIVELEKYR